MPSRMALLRRYITAPDYCLIVPDRCSQLPHGEMVGSMPAVECDTRRKIQRGFRYIQQTSLRIFLQSIHY